MENYVNENFANLIKSLDAITGSRINFIQDVCCYFFPKQPFHSFILMSLTYSYKLKLFM